MECMICGEEPCVCQVKIKPLKKARAKKAAAPSRPARSQPVVKTLPEPVKRTPAPASILAAMTASAAEGLRPGIRPSRPTDEPGTPTGDTRADSGRTGHVTLSSVGGATSRPMTPAARADPIVPTIVPTSVQPEEALENAAIRALASNDMLSKGDRDQYRMVISSTPSPSERALVLKLQLKEGSGQDEHLPEERPPG